MFQTDPFVDFVLKPLSSFDATELPGLSKWLSETIRDLISDTLVRPQALTLNYGNVYV